MGGRFVCEVCGKGYGSRRSLKRHMGKAHAEAPEVEASAQVEAPSVAEVAENVIAFSPKMLERALGDLGIERDAVMAHKVYPDRVVVIEGPTGYKRVWQRPGRRGQ